MAHPKHDYDSDDFYDDILTYAMQGFNDAEIADAMNLDPEGFNTMKNGKYIGWNEEQNARRGARILKVLARGRRKITAIVRGRYLKAAIGGIKTKNVQKVIKPIYDDNGTATGEEMVVQINESEIEQPPNMQALSTWLYHHDPEWRRIQRGEPDPEEIPNSENGLNIEAWIARENDKINNITEEDIINS